MPGLKVRGLTVWLQGALLAALAAGSFVITKRTVPPTVGVDSPIFSALVVALGGSRGILAEILWLRIGDLQQQNRYAEVVPLTDLLVVLDPASEDAWAYHAWNLAYNISTAHTAPEERWRWVRRGIELLHRGLRVMPESTTLLRQMGWLFESKIWGDLDTASAYYRAHLSELGRPEQADAFAAAAGLAPDWDDPLVHALFWYWRAGDAYDTLRVLTVCLRHSQNPAVWLPFFTRTVRAAWPDLAPQQAEQVRSVVRALAQRHPTQAALKTLLEEIWQ